MASQLIKSILTYQLLASFLLEMVQATIPEYCSGVDNTISIENQHVLMQQPFTPDRQELADITFPITFSQNPQIIMSIYKVDGACQGFQIAPKNIDINGFTIQYQVFQDREVNTIFVRYLAVVDQNIQISNQMINQDIIGTAYFQNEFVALFTSLPNAVIFLYGFNFNTCSDNIHFQILMDSITQDKYRFKVSTNYLLNYLSVGVLAGIADYLDVFEQLEYEGSYKLISINPLIYAYGFGMTGFVFNSIPFIRYQITDEITPTDYAITISISTWSSPNLIQFGYSQFTYKPCSSSQDCGPLNPSPLYQQFPPNTLTFCPASAFMNQQLNWCLPCLTKCSTCATNSQNCLTCIDQQLNPPLCTCPTNKYLDTNNQCQECPVWCIQCDINTCYGCSQNCLSCNLQSCLSCIADNYFISNNQCIQCPIGCATCNMFQCLTCILHLQLVNGICINQCISPCITCQTGQCLQCLEGFYTSSNNCMKCPDNCITCINQTQCLSCDQDSMRILNYQNDCVCMEGYQLLNNICVKHPEIHVIPQQYITISNCVQMNTNSPYTKCIKCVYGYNTINNECQQCDVKCLDCVQQVNVCNICRFTINTYDNQCQLCESQPGYYSNYQTNQCYTICGDGIIAGQEECDNDIYTSGCTQCQINPDYTCLEYECSNLIYPIPTLKQISDLNSIYNNTKVFQLSYQVQLQQFDFNDVFKIQSKNLSIKFTFQQQQIYNNVFIFQIQLNSGLIGSNIQMYFDTSKIKSQQGLQQQIQLLTSEISDYIQVSLDEQDKTQNSQIAINAFMIILLILVSITVLFGGIEIYWNLLDLLQRISYLQYVNTIKPYNLKQIIQIFGFVQLNNLPINKYLNIQNYILNYITASQYQSPPLLIAYDGYNCIALLNLIPIAVIWIISVLIYTFFKLIRRQVLYYQIDESIRFLHPLLKIQYYFIKQINIVCSQWIWSGIIRVQQSTVYDLTFTIGLGFYGIKSTLNGDEFLTISLSVVHLIVLEIFFTTANLNLHTLSNNKNKFGALIEGVKLGQGSIHYNNVKYLNKIIFIVLLILLYNKPILQISCIILLELFQIMMLLSDPLTSSIESRKQWICEIFMLIAEFVLELLVIDDYLDMLSYYQRNQLGWLCTASVIIIIITQLLFDATQQIILYHKKYSIVKNIIQRTRAIIYSIF